MVQTFIVAPVELLKIRQQLQSAVCGDAAYVGPVQLLRRLLAAEGVRGEAVCVILVRTDTCVSFLTSCKSLQCGLGSGVLLQLLYSSTQLAACDIAEHAGCTGLYRGLGVTMARDTPSHGVYFCTYDAAREALDPGSRARSTSAPAASFAAGARILAGCCGRGMRQHFANVTRL